VSRESSCPVVVVVKKEDAVGVGCWCSSRSGHWAANSANEMPSAVKCACT
jgi:hypothetical protein